MPPPHLSQKTSGTSSQAPARRGARQVKQHVELYEEEVTNDHNTVSDLEPLEAEAVDLTGDTLTEPSQDASQPNPVQQLLRDMQADQHKRNEHRKKTLYKAYKDGHADAQDAIISYFDEHEASAAAAHEAQMSRLTDLLKMKAEIEREMAGKLAKLRGDYLYHSKAVEKVIEHRMKQLNEG
ncbi:hypothetical protein PMIN06_006548 [Paraphaeosphaeria minitans]|uniref:Uncharacterized protein n=1 Tax=Paraphaeosphaeria minitans TaxID=565426 RepID=A0A9P6KKK7_9PLEO|nr:hypothetical protein PMIN01_11452 [Paraphaeosphaeria minitans]